MNPESDPLRLAGRLVDACPSPALLVEAGGRLRSANRAATALLGLAAGGAEPSLRDLVSAQSPAEPTPHAAADEADPLSVLMTGHLPNLLNRLDNSMMAA